MRLVPLEKVGKVSYNSEREIPDMWLCQLSPKVFVTLKKRLLDRGGLFLFIS